MERVPQTRPRKGILVLRHAHQPNLIGGSRLRARRVPTYISLWLASSDRTVLATARGPVLACVLAIVGLVAGYPARFADQDHCPSLRARATMMFTASTVASTATPIATVIVIVIVASGALIRMRVIAATALRAPAAPAVI